MYCKYCGRQIADDSKFCEFCGSLVGRDKEAAADIPVNIGAPIFKEVIFEEPAKEPEAAPIEEPAGEQIEKGELIVEPTPPEPEKKSKKGLLRALICGGAAVVTGLVILLVILFGGKTVKVDLTQYVDFKVSGYEGYGKATCEMDYDGLEVAVLGEYPKGTDSKTRAKQIEYKEKAALLRAAVQLKFEARENVKVGDEIKATIEVSATIEKELDVQFGTVRKVTYTVKQKDLSGSSEIDLLGEFVTVKFEGLSGKATATLSPKERKEPYSVIGADGTEYTVSVEVGSNTALSVKFLNKEDNSTETVTVPCTLDKQTDLRLGDKVTLTIAEGDKAALMEYGLVIGKTQAEFTVEGLESLVSAFKEIDKKTLSSWKKTYAQTLEKMINKNWAEYFHGGNELETTVQTVENVTYLQGVLVSGEESSELYLIYSAEVADDAILTENFGLPQTCYFAVRVSHLRLSDKGKFMTDKVILPQNNTDDFIGSYFDSEELISELTADADSYVLEK